ncbi:MAG: hypothetical protein D4R65_05495 [Verrucomicrobiaceae bacterium]|nr:MAG: hypothetical protein D4R65_05495 [Verrucomicrobiaceae bacterium]
MTLNPLVTKASLTTTTACKTVTLADTTGIEIGSIVSATGIAGGVTVTAINPGVSITLSSNATASGTVAGNFTVSNTYGGNTVLNSGTLNLNSQNALGTGSLTINGGTLGQTVSSNSPVMSNNNLITINGDFTFNGTGNGNLDLGAGDVTLGTSVGSNRTINVVNSGSTLFIGGNITNGSGGANQIIKTGAGTLDLSGNSTAAPISGGAVIKQGTLNIGFGNNAAGGNVVNAVGNGTIVLGDAGALDARLSTGSFTVANDIQLGTGATGNLIIGSTGATRSAIFSGNVTMNGDNLTLLNSGSSVNHRFTGNFVGAGNLTIMNNATGTGFVWMNNGTINNGGNITAFTNCGTNGGTAINGNIGSSVVDVIASGPGTLTLNGTNSYTGNTTLGATGTLKIGNASALGNGAMVTINQNSNIAATTNMTTTKNFVLFGSLAGAQTIGAAASQTLTINGTIDATASALTIGGASGSGTLVLNGANLFASGTTTLVNANASLAMGNALSLNGTTLKYNGGNMLDNTGTGANAFTAPVGLQGFILTDAVTFNGTNSLDLSGVETGFVQTAGRTRTITVNANTLTMNGIQATGTAVNSGAAFLDGNMTKTGAGTLVLAGTNGYTGTTIISLGTLQIGNGGSLGSLSTNSTISNNGTLAFNRNNTVTQGTDFNSVISGNGSVEQKGTGTLILNGTNTYNGTTTVTSGTLAVSGAGTLGSTTGNLTVAGGIMELGGTSQTKNVVTFTGGTTQNGTLTASTYATQNGTVSAVLAGAGGLTKTTAGTVVLSGTNTYNGTTTITGGILDIAATTNIGNGVGQIGNTGTGMVYVPTGGNFSANNFNVGNTSGFGSVVINGGTVATTTATTSAGFAYGAGGYGSFFMSSGNFTTRRLDGGGASVLSTAVNVAQISGGNFTNSEYILLRGAYSEFTLTGGTVNHNAASNVISLEGTAGVSTTLNVAGGLLDNTGQTVTFGRVAGITTSASLNLDGGTLLTGAIAATAANISGSANVNFNGGTLKASAASTTFLPVGLNNAYVNGAFGTFAGGAVIDTNTFDLTFAKGLSAPTGNGVSGLTVGSAGSGYIGAPLVEITGGGGTGATGYAVVDLDPASGTFGQVTSVVLTNPGVGYTSTPTINLLGGGGSGAGVSASGIAANTSGGLIKNGTGTLTLSANGTYSGGTTINAGSVQATARNAMGTGVVTVTGTGTFLYNTDAFVEGLVYNKAGGSSLFNNSPTTQYITIGASGIVNQSGAGQLTIANTSNRPVSVILGSSQTWTNNGTKILMNGCATATVNTLDLGANTLTLVGTGSGGYEIDAPIIGTGNIVKNSTGNLTVTKSNTYNGTTTINSGTLNVGTGTDAGSIANTSAITNNGSLVYNVGSGVRTLAAPISGTGSLTQNSTGGTLTLTGTNTYTGATVITTGSTLQVGAGTDAGSIANTSAVTNNGALVYNVGNGTRTLGAVISGSGSVTQSSSGGTLTLSNTNTYGGSTLVTAGTLVVSGTINNTSGVQVDGGTFNYTGATGLSRNVVVNSGGTFRYNSAAAMTSVITLNAGATLGGSGSIGAISGAGSVEPGNSPGILTATTADFSGGLGFKFEFGATGNPTWSDASSSVNDVLHLTNTSTPFLNSATASNVFDIYFGVASITVGNKFNGGFFAGTADFSTTVDNGSYNYYVFGDGAGLHDNNGTKYYTLSEYNVVAGTSWTVDHGTFAVNGANFTDATVNGYVQQFNVVPEPAAWILAAFGLTTAVVFRRRRRD